MADERSETPDNTLRLNPGDAGSEGFWDSFEDPRDPDAAVRTYLRKHQYVEPPEGDFPSAPDGSPCAGKGHRFAIEHALPTATVVWRCSRKNCKARCQTTNGIPEPPDPYAIRVTGSFRLVDSHEPSMSERTKIVAWLRAGATHSDGPAALWLDTLANAVERGEHLGEPGPT